MEASAPIGDVARVLRGESLAHCHALSLALGHFSFDFHSLIREQQSSMEVSTMLNIRTLQQSG
jgi:hypothetical protein